MFPRTIMKHLPKTKTKQSKASQTTDLESLLKILTDAIPNVINKSSPTLEDSRLEGIRTCEKISALLHDPFQWFVESAAYIFPAAISILLELKAPHYVSKDPQHPTELGELAEKTGAPVDVLGK